MIKPLLILTIFAISSLDPSHAQVAFPTDGAIWVNTHYMYYFNPPIPIPESVLTDVDYYCVHGEDTTISGNDYTKLFHCGEAYKGALREVNSVVFFVPADSTDEYLLYDFSAQQGQTIENVFIGNHSDDSFSLQDFTVNQVSTETIGGVSRRVVYADSFRWIEGIGCETGLFMEPWANVSNYSVILHCMSVNGMTLFPIEGNASCSMTVGVESDPLSMKMSVYPNPTREELTIKMDKARNFSIEVINIRGQIEQSATFSNANQAQLNLTGESGLYIIRIMTEEGHSENFRIAKL